MCQLHFFSTTFVIDMLDALLARDMRARVDALARGEISCPPATPIQQACGLNPALAFLATIAIPQPHAPPFTTDEDNLFARLQLYYRQALGQPSGAHTLYKLSPLVAPALASSPSAANEQLVGSTPDELEAKAKRAEVELLELLKHEESRAAKSANSKARSKKEKPRKVSLETSALPASSTCSSSNSTRSAPASDDTTTLEELSAARSTPMCEADYCASEWTQAGAKSRATNAHVRAATNAKGTDRLPSSPPPASPPAAPKATTVTAAPSVELAAQAPARGATVSVDAPKRATNEAELDITNAACGVDSRANTTDNTTDSTTNTVDKIDETPCGTRGAHDESVVSLRMQLEAVQVAHAEELARIRAAHQRTLTLAQERESTRLQALQLRLYIQTSRVALLEGALAKHVATVGNLLHTSVDVAPEEMDALNTVQDDAARLVGSGLRRSDDVALVAERPPGAPRALALAVHEASEMGG